MQNKNRFPHQHMFSVVSVFEPQKGLMFDGIHVVLRNPNDTNPEKRFRQD